MPTGQERKSIVPENLLRFCFPWGKLKICRLLGFRDHPNPWQNNQTCYSALYKLTVCTASAAQELFCCSTEILMQPGLCRMAGFALLARGQFWDCFWCFQIAFWDGCGNIQHRQLLQSSQKLLKHIILFGNMGIGEYSDFKQKHNYLLVPPCYLWVES